MRILGAHVRRSVRLLMANGVLGALLAISCGGDDPPTASVTPTEGSGSITVVVEGSSYSVERIEVQAGATTAITLDNRDDVTHTFTVYFGDTPDGAVAAGTGEVPGGERGEAVVLFSASGVHAFRCEFHPVGMNGVIVVR